MLQNAARIAREIVSFRHPRISAVKLAVADPNADLLRGDMTADEMREIIRGKLVEEGLLLRQLSTSASARDCSSTPPTAARRVLRQTRTVIARRK